MTPRPNADGSRSTELTVTVPMENGGWSVVPSLWWKKEAMGEPWKSRELPLSDRQFGRLAGMWDNERWPRFRTPTEATWWARTRSNMGGGESGL
jgi:hypothetical protein